MDTEENDTDGESEVSFGSSHSSCETSPSTLCPPVPFFIDPSNVGEFQNYLRTKQQAMIENMQVKAGVVFFGRVPHTFGEAQLTKFFSRYGRIQRVRVFDKSQERKMRRHSHSKSSAKGRVAYMQFANSDEAKLAVQAVGESPVYAKLFQCQFMEGNEVPSDAFHSAGDDERLGGKLDRYRPATPSRNRDGKSASPRSGHLHTSRRELKDSDHSVGDTTQRKKRRSDSHHRSKSQRKRARHSPHGQS